MKKVIFLYLILFTGVPISCDFTQSQSTSFLFRIESLDIAVGQFQNASDFSSFQEMEFDPAPADTLSSSNLAIEIRIGETTVVASATSSWLMYSAYADPAPPRSESLLALISIYADESIFAEGNEYEAGENLTNLFSLSSLYRSEPTTILKFIEQADEWNLNNNLYLTLTTPLDKPLAQSLLLNFTLENGTIFRLESDKIVAK